LFCLFKGKLRADKINLKIENEISRENTRKQAIIRAISKVN
jgi:hypothetical protein